MSFFGMGRPQPSSAEKIAAVEQNMKLMADMHNRYVPLLQMLINGGAVG
jgi:import inner membrane translocase subunit TIM10